MKRFLFLLAKLLTLLLASFIDGYAHDRALLPLPSKVVDIVESPKGDGLLLFTQTMLVYRADSTSDAWHTIDVKLNVPQRTVTIGRIGGVISFNNTIVVSGHIVSTVTGKPHSGLLRSTDGGITFDLVEVSADTLATTDNIKATTEGRLFFNDRVGRVWVSDDVGISWREIKIPKTISVGSIREVDFTSNNLGVAIDVDRNFHFTTNAFSSSITPLPSAREITERQPTLLDYYSWERSVMFWGNDIILNEGSTIFRTPSNDLLWSPWYGVVVIGQNRERTQLAYWRSDGTLWRETPGSPAKKIASDVLRPDLVRILGNQVVTYRPDTGPVVYHTGSVTMIRPYHPKEVISEPTIVSSTASTEGSWGVLQITGSAVLVDILRKSPAGWKRDTVLPIGPVYVVKELPTGDVVVGDLRTKFLINKSTRTVSSYTIDSPLTEFLKKPVARFRLRIAADELDSTHVQWAEFRKVGKEFRCAELVDSSRYGVSSSLISVGLPIARVAELLNGIQQRGGKGLLKSDVSITAEDVANYKSMLDTLFAHDAYFDVYDLYRPPPTALEQIAQCKKQFARVVDTIAALTTSDIESAILAWRSSPKDDISRYEIEFENTAGKIAVFRIYREDDAHPPMMQPWIGNAQGLRWMIFGTELTTFFKDCIPAEHLPRMFTLMTKKEYLLAAIASWLDQRNYGRTHRWAQREVTPEAK